MSEWENSKSKHLLGTLGTNLLYSSPRAWWEVALLSNSKLPKVGPTVFPVVHHIRALMYEQTDLFIGGTTGPN